MASNLLRGVTKSSLVRSGTLCKIQTRNSSGSSSESVRPSSNNSSSLSLAVGMSLGLGVGLLAQSNLVNKLFPSEPVPEKVVPTTDPKIIEEVIDQSRKINHLEFQLAGLRQDIRERELELAKKQSPPVQVDSSYVFSLGQVIEANNLANSNRHKAEQDELRQSLMQEYLNKLESEVSRTENRYKPIFNKVKKLEAHLESQKQLQEREGPARLLWISCQALLDRLRYAPHAPLEKDAAYDVLRQFAAGNHPLAIKVLESIPAKALKEGVYSEESLIDRYSKVEKVCRRVAMVDESGGGVTKYLVSYLQSIFIIDQVKVAEDEIAGKKLVDPTTWHTYDILARIRYCLSKHNLEQAIRYANQLKGQSRVVARDWIRDARVHLETKQAFAALSAYAEAIAVDAIRQNIE